MSWQQVAGPHVGHRMVLRGVYELRCVDCQMTLVVHKEAGTQTPLPPPWKRLDTPPASPELIALRKREAMAAVEQARLKRTGATT